MFLPVQPRPRHKRHRVATNSLTEAKKEALAWKVDKKSELLSPEDSKPTDKGTLLALGLR